MHFSIDKWNGSINRIQKKGGYLESVHGPIFRFCILFIIVQGCNYSAVDIGHLCPTYLAAQQPLQHAMKQGRGHGEGGVQEILDALAELTGKYRGNYKMPCTSSRLWPKRRFHRKSVSLIAALPFSPAQWMRPGFVWDLPWRADNAPGPRRADSTR